MANEKRLISADALKEHLKSYTGMFTDEIGFAVSLEAVLWGIDAAPKVDAVEVIRCKDCWKSAEGLCSYQFKNVPGKDFCGDGERKDND